MRSLLLSLSSVVAAISCVSCGPSGPAYTQGPPDLTKSAMFVVQTKEGSLFNNSHYALGRIDGFARGRAVTFPNGEKGIAVTPGQHRITVATLHGSSEFQNGMLSGEAEIPMKVKAGVVYEPFGSVIGRGQVDLWIRERDTGKKASPVVSFAPKNHRPVVPIMVPVG